MLRNIIGPVFNFRNCVFFCCLFLLVFQKSSSFCRDNEIFKKKKQKKQKKMDQFLTLKRAKNGPVFNFTAYIYIYIYICMLRSQQSDHVNPGITPVIGPPQCHYLAHVHFRTTKTVVWCVDVVFGKKWSLPKIYGFFWRLFGFVAVF